MAGAEPELSGKLDERGERKEGAAGDGCEIRRELCPREATDRAGLAGQQEARVSFVLSLLYHARRRELCAQVPPSVRARRGPRRSAYTQATCSPDMEIT